MTKLKTLYKITKTRSIQICNISYEGDTFYVEFGKLDGKMQIKSTQCFAKNIGKANETSPEQQAEIEALAKFSKKLKERYVLSSSGESDINLPQKVHKYQENMNKITFPAYESPKLNGINSTYKLIDNELKHYSRGGEEFPVQEHQREDILSAMDLLKTTVLNGEQYIHGEYLEDIQSAVTKTNELSNKLEFYLFDLPETGNKYKTNRELMLTLPCFFNINVVLSHPVKSHENIDNRFKHYIKLGYEGLMVYNANGVYAYNERTYDVLKYKIPLDAEFKVVNYDVDKNKHPVLHMITKTRLKFKAKPKGTSESKEKILKDIDNHIGSWWKIEFESWSKRGVPLKPIAICKRECNTKGEPLT